MIIDRQQSLELIQELFDLLEKMKDLKFPDYTVMKENSERISGNNQDKEGESEDEEDEIDSQLADYIDYRLEFITI